MGLLATDRAREDVTTWFEFGELDDDDRFVGMTAYSASKAAVRNLARTWAEDLKGTGIRLNVLSPGATATELAKAALGEEGQKVYASMTPLLSIRRRSQRRLSFSRRRTAAS